MRIYLIRHGQNSAQRAYDANLGYPNPGLDRTGVRQAELLGERLQDHEIDAIYSSDLRRAKDTADIVNRYLKADIIAKPQLREIDMGAIFLRGWEAFPEYYSEWLKHEADLPYPQGETGSDVQERTWPVVEGIIGCHSQDVALVTHGGVIMVLLSACLGMGMEKRFKFEPPANCSISTLNYHPGEGMFKVEKVNDTTHLSSIKTLEEYFW